MPDLYFKLTSGDVFDSFSMLWEVTQTMSNWKYKAPPLPQGTHKVAMYTRKSKWIPRPEYDVPGSFKVYSPTNAYPNTFKSHFYTRKYAQFLVWHRPDLYFKLTGIDPGSEKGRLIMEEHVAARLGLRGVITEM